MDTEIKTQLVQITEIPQDVRVKPTKTGNYHREFKSPFLRTLSKEIDTLEQGKVSRTFGPFSDSVESKNKKALIYKVICQRNWNLIVREAKTKVGHVLYVFKPLNLIDEDELAAKREKYQKQLAKKMGIIQQLNDSAVESARIER